MTISQRRMQREAMGRLPDDLAAGRPAGRVTPEYIEETATAPDDVWAREQARYRARSDENR